MGLKFDVKLGVVVKKFKITEGTWLFFWWVQKLAFKTHLPDVILKIKDFIKNSTKDFTNDFVGRLF